MDSRLAYVMATSRSESFRRDAERYAAHRIRRRRPTRRAPRIPLVLMFLRATRG
jgi:hypothetical protein